MKRQLPLLGIFLTLSLLSPLGFAASVMPLGIDKLHAGADLIFYGECLSQQTSVDQTLDIPVTQTTFKVLEMLKGKAGEEITIKQIGGTAPGQAEDIVVPGVPRFELGKKYVLFLPKQSELGFTTPVAMDQGRFSIEGEHSGNAHIGNGRDFKELLSKVPSGKIPARINDRLKQLADKHDPESDKAKEELPLDDFLSLMRSMK
jgi:hypothetical protein